jgi:hypothetical protein
MANRRSFCFIIAFHNFATLKNRLTYQCPSSWPVVITIKKKISQNLEKKYRILAGPNEWQQVCNRSNPGKTGRSCEGADFSSLSSKVSQALLLTYPNWTDTNTLATHPTLSHISGPNLDLSYRVSVLNIPGMPTSLYPADLLPRTRWTCHIPS